MTISRTFPTLKKANRFLDALYARYGHVRLIRAPRFSEEGVYVWEVR